MRQRLASTAQAAVRALSSVARGTVYTRFTPRAFSAIGATGHAIDSATEKFLGSDPTPDKRAKAALVKRLVEDERNEVLTHPAEDAPLLHLIKSIAHTHADQTPDEQALILAKALHRYNFKPVITAHPTDPRADHAIWALHSVADIVEKMDGRSLTDSGRTALEENILTLMEKPLVPDRKMTPEEEGKRFVEYWQCMVTAYPEVKKQILSDVQREIYGGKPIPDSITKELTAAIKKQFTGLATWVASDRDGNSNITGEGTRQIIQHRQVAILDFFAKEGRKLLDKAPLGSDENAAKLQTTIDFWERVKRTMETMQSYFNQENSDKAKVKTLAQLDALIDDPVLPADTKESLLALRDRVDLMGYTGIPGADIREDVAEYGKAMGDVFSLLRHHSNGSVERLEAAITSTRDARSRIALQEMRGLLTTQESYDGLSKEDKSRFIHLLGQDSIWFRQLQDHQDELGESAKKCFGCMKVQLEYPDIFRRDIMSEAKDVVNAKELAVLQSITRYLNGQFHIGDYGLPPGRILFLQETPGDLGRSAEITKDVLATPSFRAAVAREGVLQSLKGPSDNTARGGLMAMVKMLEAMNAEEDALAAMQKTYPEIAHAYMETFHGSGGDWKRQLTALCVLHQTFQGKAAYDLLAKPGAMAKAIYSCAGQMGEIEKMALELRQLQERSPDQYERVMGVVDQCTGAYSDFIKSTEIRELYPTLLGERGAEILDACNVSSRAGAKKAGAKAGAPYLDTIRAISQVTYGLMAAINSEITHSLVGITDVEDRTLDALSDASHLTVFRNITAKLFFSAATSCFPYAWQAIGVTKPLKEKEIRRLGEEYSSLTPEERAKSPKHVLAHLQLELFNDLERATYLLPRSEGTELRSFLARASKENGALSSPHSVAQGMMHTSELPYLNGGGRDTNTYASRYAYPAWRAIAEYKEDPTDSKRELAVGWVRATNWTRPWQALHAVQSSVHLDEKGWVTRESYQREVASVAVGGK